MTIQYGYPPANLASRSSQSAMLKPIGFESGAQASPDGYTTAQITAINLQIAAGTADFPTGSWVRNTDTEVIYQLSGLAGNRAFRPAGGSVVLQGPRVANFNFAGSDTGTVILTGANLSATLLASAALDVNFMCELRNVGAFTINAVAGAGATLFAGGASVGSVQITTEGASIVIVGSGTANKFYANKIGT